MSEENVKPEKIKRLRETPHLIMVGSTGLILLAFYFLLVTASPLHRYLESRASRDEVINTADEFFKKMPLDHSLYRRTVVTGIDKSLLEYAQFHKKNHDEYPEIVPGYWSVSFFPRNVKQDLEHPKNFFRVKYDFNGNLLGFWDKTPRSDKLAVLAIEESDALFDARFFLGEYGVKTRNLKLTHKETREGEKAKQYKFVFEETFKKYPGLLKRYTVELEGNHVVSYEHDRVMNSTETAGLTNNRFSKIAGILVLIMWVLITLAIAVRFFRKLRRDELEFKRAIRFGIVIGLAVAFWWVLRIIKDGFWIPYLVGGALISVFVFLGTLVLLPLAESQSRAAWPEKLAFTDLLLEGKVFFRETGSSILRSFFLVGLTLLPIGIFFYASSAFDIGYASISGGMVNMFQNTVNSLGMVQETLLLGVFFGLTILSFWPAFLREKIANNRLFVFLLAVSFSISGLQFVMFQPQWSSLVVVVLTAIIWAWMVYRYDLLTIFISFLGVRFFLGLSGAFIEPGVIFSLFGMIVMIFTAVFFLLGAYLVFQPRSADDFDSYVPEYVSRIAEKERMVRELEIARSVQMRFLPQKVPQFPHLEIVSLCQPAMEVGGDYYDFIQMDERHMSVLIGDVSGKGVSAAFYMTMVKGIIKTLSKKTRQPATLLAEANEIFCENAPRNVFVTIIYGVFDLQERKLVLASAGHNPVMIWKKKTGNVEMVNPRGIALGLEKGERYGELIEEVEIPIDEDDVFVFYTDGVSESMNGSDEIYGETRLEEVIKQSAHLTPRMIQRNIVESVSRFSGKAPQHDDFTMVVVKVLD